MDEATKPSPCKCVFSGARRLCAKRNARGLQRCCAVESWTVMQVIAAVAS